MIKSLFEILEITKFPKNKTRKNVAGDLPTEAFALGTVNYRGQKSLGGKTQGPSKWNKKFPELFEIIQNLAKNEIPDFEYTTVQINKNILSLPHIDKNNVGESYIVALGDFEGGELVIEGEPFNIKDTWKIFDGNCGHWVNPFVGTRYSLVFFTHTFKPPSPLLRYIKVTKDGLYKKDLLIKKYIHC